MQFYKKGILSIKLFWKNELSIWSFACPPRGYPVTYTNHKNRVNTPRDFPLSLSTLPE